VWLQKVKTIEGRNMASVGQVFKCELCGNVVKVIEEGGNSEIHCCGQAMTEVND
jgi:desulfoferrodoxin-like iron-binding protein